MDSGDWDERYRSSEFVWSVTPNRFLVAETAGLTPARALDVASGEGRNAVWLAEQGWMVTAVDFSEVGMEKGRKLAESRGVEVQWILADVTEYQPRPSAYDLVIVLYLQLPADSRRRAFGKCVSGLETGGLLLYVGHDLDNIEHGYGGPQAPEVLTTPEAMTELLTTLDQETEIEIIKAERVIRQVETEEGTREAIDTLILARRAG
ncbi:MAG: hypothetical protein JJLCMIEE_03448 [Acidimicrobiales bacterium]|nr:MAG: class I SAM-dependent methyltransferase [Actinomycetota bacterium]MBV6510309.1 hypothetical protein [Acidimicrobiales bacterium]RIK03393.1 MAG: class I SAM-dependent methyltransferase [Acidobacteriota bacterium]